MVKNKVLFKNEWISLRETPDGYAFAHEEKSNGEGVAVLAYRDDPFQLVGRFEECPPHGDGIALCTLTGMIDAGETPIQTAQRELLEESGISVEIEELRSLGTVRTSKGSDTTLHLFAVEVGDREPGEAEGDGTALEESAYCDWVSPATAVKSKDANFSVMLLRLAQFRKDNP